MANTISRFKVIRPQLSISTFLNRKIFLIDLVHKRRLDKRTIMLRTFGRVFIRDHEKSSRQSEL